MASLVSKDCYLQTLAKKICTQETHEPRKRKFGNRSGDKDTPPKKKKKRMKRKNLPKQNKTDVAPPSKFSQESTAASGSEMKKRGPPVTQNASGLVTVVEQRNGERTAGVQGSKSTAGSSFAIDLLRQRLHDKIQELSGKGSCNMLSPSMLEKRQRRKYERERKKRRRKEIKMKEKLEMTTKAEEASAPVVSESQEVESKAEILFNKVEVCAEEELGKEEKRKEKRKAVKGNITPLTGKNYKQLLSRLESRKNKLEELKAKDEEKAKELEAKMKWTNVLYKAEGIKIRDNEERLKAALKNKEKRKAQHQRQWEKRTVQVVEKMQQRQEKRRKNIQKKKLAKQEKKKTKARKKGRILPEDLEKASRK